MLMNVGGGEHKGKSFYRFLLYVVVGNSKAFPHPQLYQPQLLFGFN